MNPNETKTIMTTAITFTMTTRRRLLAAALLCCIGGIAGCARHGDMPSVPQSPPRPMTWNGHLFTAQLDLPARPVPAPPGEM